MDTARLLNTLQHSSMDRETKLMIIDLLNLSHDPKLEEEISQLVFEWEQADKAIVNALLHRFDEIQLRHEQGLQMKHRKEHSDTLNLADLVAREQQIKKVRDYIETL